MCLARPIERVPLLIAPAMNREMWAHPATQRNLAQLRGRRRHHPRRRAAATRPAARPATAACWSRTNCSRTWSRSSSPSCWPAARCWSPPARPSRRIDPVRGITNHVGGKMGFAIARAAREAGADVTLVAGPVQPADAARRAPHRREVGARHADAALPEAPRPTSSSPLPRWPTGGRRTQPTQKIKKDGTRRRAGAGVRREPRHPRHRGAQPSARSGQLFCVGFAAESHDLVAARAGQARAQGHSAAGGQHRAR